MNRVLDWESFVTARQRRLDRALTAEREGNSRLARIIRDRVRLWDHVEGAWDRFDLEESLPERKDGAAAEYCECDAATRICSCAPLRESRHDAEHVRAPHQNAMIERTVAVTVPTERRDTMDPVEQARLERNARNTLLAKGEVRTDSDEFRAAVDRDITDQRRRATHASARADHALREQRERFRQ
jgi:hypothetical protein